MNTFSELLRICGPTARDAALLFQMQPRAVVRWKRGVCEPSDEAIALLGELQTRQQDVADAILTSWVDAGRTPSLSIAVAQNDEDARAMGWPSLAAQIAPIAIAQAILGPVKINLERGADVGADTAGIAAE